VAQCSAEDGANDDKLASGGVSAPRASEDDVSFALAPPATAAALIALIDLCRRELNASTIMLRSEAAVWAEIRSTAAAHGRQYFLVCAAVTIAPVHRPECCVYYSRAENATAGGGGRARYYAGLE
jgi:hypothetical protein